MRDLRLSICRIDRKCIDYEGEWDGTWDEWYEYIIFNDEGEIVDQENGFGSREKAKEAGEKRLKSMEEK